MPKIYLAFWNIWYSLLRKYLYHIVHLVAAESVSKTMVQSSTLSQLDSEGRGEGSVPARVNVACASAPALLPGPGLSIPLLHWLQHSALRVSVPPSTSYPQKKPDRMASKPESRAGTEHSGSSYWYHPRAPKIAQYLPGMWHSFCVSREHSRHIFLLFISRIK